MENEDKQTLLNLARKVIKAKLENKKLEIDVSKIPDSLKQKRGTFVTLRINNELRGCIGHIAPVQEIYKDVIENSRAAAFSDPRFPPLTKNEFEKIDIEISILSESKKIEYNSPISLVKILEEEKPGVILRQGARMATFLPQVWDELPNAEQFLSHLCLKAGLNPNGWIQGETEIEIYTVEKISILDSSHYSKNNLANRSSAYE